MAVPDLLALLGIRPSAESRDFVAHKQQFHLHGLLTEQRHPNTRELATLAEQQPERALERILQVDQDVVERLEELASTPDSLLRLAAAITAAIQDGRRIYVYGCGATGRLAKQLESSFWRPFWDRVARHPDGRRWVEALPVSPAQLLVGEMTGGDRALVVSLEGFEDLPLLGALQLRDHGITRGDVVIAVTEGGETSSVIGTILAARQHWGDDEAAAREHLYFVYNNPDARLRPLARSARVLDDAGITKICLATGPQALAGSTRMQATTSETYVLGAVLEHALDQLLRGGLGARRMGELGFGPARELGERLTDFARVQAAVLTASAPLADWTRAEAQVVAQGGLATYAAGRAIVTVFTDCTERSPTFRLPPLDPVGATSRRSPVQVLTEGEDARFAWRMLLGRPFRGLRGEFYGPPLAEGITDPWLHSAAQRSLAQAGDEQQDRFCFACTQDRLETTVDTDGLVVLVAVGDELAALARPQAALGRLAAFAQARQIPTFVLHVGFEDDETTAAPRPAPCVGLRLPRMPDPLELRQHIALKMLLNAHSTVTMARIGRVVGNTMAYVSPSNLKLVGRATALIEGHVRDALERSGLAPAPNFAACNAVLYDAMAWTAQRPMDGLPAEVPLAIVRILESVREGAGRSFEDAAVILGSQRLGDYLASWYSSPDCRS